MKPVALALGVLLLACATPASVETAPPPSAPATTAPSTTVPETSTLVETTSTSAAAPTTVAATTVPATTLAELQGLSLDPVATGLASPTALTQLGEVLLVTERGGRILSIHPERGLAEEPWLDLSPQVTSTGIEQGLLGIATHPDGDRVYFYYVDSSGSRTLSRIEVSDGEPVANSELILFSEPQPPGSVDIRHYGGALAFGPDGYLYVAVGDGADARGQGQNPDTIFGTVLRLDVSADPYTIPPDNPFPDGGAPEVWVYGLRNPWRFAIDSQDDLIYIADVGQETWEEINVVPLRAGGTNFGWPDTEGAHCFLADDCDLTEYELPVLEYGHDEGCSVTGGHVYRGPAIPELSGHYFYADWCRGWVRSFRFVDGEATDQRDWSEDLAEAGQVNAFAVDASGEIYIASYEGNVFRVVPVR